jgi:hypothetical protein
VSYLILFADTGGKFTAGVIDTGGIFATGINNINGIGGAP